MRAMEPLDERAFPTRADRGRCGTGSAAECIRCRTAALVGATLLVALGAWPAMAGEQPMLAERTEIYFRYLEIKNHLQKLALVEPHWLADGNRFWYAAGGREETGIYLVDPVANTRVELFDTTRVREALEEHVGHAPPHRGLPFDEFYFVGQAEGAVRFIVGGTEYELDLDSYALQPLREPPAEPPSALAGDGRWYRDAVGPYFLGRIHGVPSSDGAWLLEAEDHDLWLRSTRDGGRRRLTTDGEPDHRWHAIHPGSGGRRTEAESRTWRGARGCPAIRWRRPFLSWRTEGSSAWRSRSGSG